jgi:hypothetical protein
MAARRVASAPALLAALLLLAAPLRAGARARRIALLFAAQAADSCSRTFALACQTT